MTIQSFFAFSIIFLLTSCSTMPRELGSALAAYPDLKVQEIGDTFVVTGEVNEMNVHVAIGALLNDLTAVNKNGKSFVSQVTLSERGQAAQADAIQSKIGVAEISARFVGNALFLEGISPDDFHADRAVEVARSMLSRAHYDYGMRQPSGLEPRIVDLIRVSPPKKR